MSRKVVSYNKEELLPEQVTKKPVMTVKDRYLNSVFQSGTQSQINKFYADANTELLRKVIQNRLGNNPDRIVTKRYRERQSYLQEVAKEYINNFKVLNRVYFKKVGDEYLSQEFQDLIGDHATTSLLKKKTQANNPKSGDPKQFLKNRSSSSVKANEQSVTVQDKDVQIKDEHALSDIKSQISNIQDYIKAYVDGEKDINSTKKELADLELRKKDILLEIQKLKGNIVSQI